MSNIYLDVSTILQVAVVTSRLQCRVSLSASSSYQHMFDYGWKYATSMDFHVDPDAANLVQFGPAVLHISPAHLAGGLPTFQLPVLAPTIIPRATDMTGPLPIKLRRSLTDVGNFAGVRTVDVQAVEGMVAQFPCDLGTAANDKVYMVFWFRDDAGIPLYSAPAKTKKKKAGHYLSSSSFLVPVDTRESKFIALDVVTKLNKPKLHQVSLIYIASVR
ncbi:hypothetical protein MSG28_002581 [Choristoneura fumiferana]|uniref:Uncharacterized protein n=1 Tax=Choristoneura fumiferana TaxID=7141 RepID=A0ACC0JW30_CHOFU|nr:hypothetical protein MSG28_002581 [Choristoneura fumiferana]